MLDELNHSIRQSQAQRWVHTFQQTLYLACSAHTRVGRGAGILGAQYMQAGASEIPTPILQEENEGRGQENPALQQRKPLDHTAGANWALVKGPQDQHNSAHPLSHFSRV